MEIPGPPAVDNPEVIHLAKLVKIELDELHRNIRWLTKRLSKPAGGPPATDLAGSPDSTPKERSIEFKDKDA